ncbi:hypothetical protein [Arthrobacter sp. 260]|uniref:hypothetical protein n=1 Tax=Arthrobacter sp. 260 TaxID=2735314 RepID=UPI001490B470|nr:hypothetical protein [Arthrobacter sp. 260]NOJ60002.1 hypothetical protein [Arthrobacter sp. 260]
MTISSAVVSAPVFDLYTRILSEGTNVSLIAELAFLLAKSGHCRTKGANCADVASTGGPSSLATLLCPLHLIDAGLDVPKIGVVGRPAGGIDVLGTVPNYKTSLSKREFERTLKQAHYAHVVADETWAPADAALFRLRQQSGTQAVPALAIASLLAKKVAAGVRLAGLEARIARFGNFGSQLGQARENSEIYCGVALELGLSPVVVITDATVPYQPYIGRGEALTAYWMVVTGEVRDPWLKTHAEMCEEIASIVTAQAPSVKLVSRKNGGSGMLASTEGLLHAQGSSIGNLQRRVESVAEEKRRKIYSKSEGFVTYDLSSIRRIVIERNATAATRSDGHVARYPDQVGVRLLCPPGLRVRRGEAILEIRSNDNDHVVGEFESKAFTVGAVPSAVPNQILEVVRP